MKHEQELGFQKNQSGRGTYYMIKVIAERQQESAKREKPGETGARPTEAPTFRYKGGRGEHLKNDEDEFSIFEESWETSS